MAGKGGKGRDGGGTIVLKRIEEGGHGHHGGAWKVAYADFVTAMMAFFLLMWLLNATSEEQRRGIADFFSPVNAFGQSTSGAGLPFAGRTPNSTANMLSDSGAMNPSRSVAPARLEIEEMDEQAETVVRSFGQGDGPVAGPGQPAARAPRPSSTDADGPSGDSLTGPETPQAGSPSPAGPAPAPMQVTELTAAEAATALAAAEETAQREAEARAERARQEHATLTRAAEDLRAAVRDDPALAELARQLVVEIVPEGLRIQLLDADRTPMFATGSANPNERVRALIQKVAQVAAKLPNDLSISGHTDATPFRGAQTDRGNWELSAERANTVRRLLADAAIPEARIRSVTGHAARQPLLPDQPAAAGNRRVAITLLRDLPATPESRR